MDLTHENSKETVKKIYRAMDEIKFKDKYGIELKLALAAPYGYKKHNENIEWCDLLLDKLEKGQTNAAVKILSRIKSNSILAVLKAK